MTDKQAEIDKLTKENNQLQKEIELYKNQEKYLLARLEYEKSKNKLGRSGR